MKVQFTEDLKGVPLIDLLLYGNAKVGKTRFAATFPSPLFISFKKEEGLESLRGLGNIPFLQVENLNEFNEAIKFVQQQLRLPKKDREVNFETVVIDSLTSLWDMLLDDLVPNVKDDQIKKEKITWDMRTNLNDHIFFYYDGIKDLKNRFGINVVFVAHADEKVDQDDILRRIGVGSMTVAKHIAKNTNYILYMTVEDGVRKIRLTADEKYQTGVRTEAGITPPTYLSGQENITYDSLMKTLGFTEEEKIEKPKIKKSKSKSKKK